MQVTNAPKRADPHSRPPGNPGPPGPPDVAGDNRLLAALPDAARRPLQRHVERVRLGTGQPLYAPDRPIEHVYFPINAVVSVFAVMPEGGRVEVLTVGNEGMVGMPVFLGADRITGQALGQIEGDAWRLPADVCRARTRRDGPLRDALQRYAQAYLYQLIQSAACSRAHSLEERCARGLLATRDRVAGDHFRLTQELLASMLGVRRATASGVMGTFRGAGAVRYTRGRVTVVDRAALESASCGCYLSMKAEYDRLCGS